MYYVHVRIPFSTAAAHHHLIVRRSAPMAIAAAAGESPEAMQLDTAWAWWEHHTGGDYSSSTQLIGSCANVAEFWKYMVTSVLLVLRRLTGCGGGRTIYHGHWPSSPRGRRGES